MPKIGQKAAGRSRKFSQSPAGQRQGRATLHNVPAGQRQGCVIFRRLQSGVYVIRNK